jgi:hypothetical protein
MIFPPHRGHDRPRVVFFSTSMVASEFSSAMQLCHPNCVVRLMMPQRLTSITRIRIVIRFTFVTSKRDEDGTKNRHGRQQQDQDAQIVTFNKL